MTTKNQVNEAVELSAAEIANYQKIAEEEFIKVQQKMLPEDASNSKIKAPFPFGATFTIGGAGYFTLHSSTPLEFTNGVQLNFKGEGGGIIIGGGVYAGAGFFLVDPKSLPQKRVGFHVVAGPGIPAPLIITWLYNNRPIGSFAGAGAAAFVGTGGGPGTFTHV